MRTIYKYDLEHKTEGRLSIPKGSKILFVGVQDNVPRFWVEIDADVKEMETYTTYIVGTGSELPSNPGQYISTIFINVFVFHIYARKD